MIKVQVVQRKGETTLVKYLEDGKILRQAILPSSCIKDDMVSTDDIEMAIQHGLPWEEIAQPKVTSEMIANKLREYDIWTLQDLEQNPNIAVGAFQSVYAIDAAALLVAARRYVKQEVE